MNDLCVLTPRELVMCLVGAFSAGVLLVLVVLKGDRRR